FEERGSLVERFGQHPAVELDPAKLTVDQLIRRERFRGNMNRLLNRLTPRSPRLSHRELLQSASSRKCVGERQLISVLQLSSFRNSLSDSGDPEVQVFDAVCNIESCGISFDGRACGKYKLLNHPASPFEPSDQIGQLRLLRADSADRRPETVKHMVEPPVS